MADIIIFNMLSSSCSLSWSSSWTPGQCRQPSQTDRSTHSLEHVRSLHNREMHPCWHWFHLHGEHQTSHHFGHCVHHWCRLVIILITSDLNLDHLHNREMHSCWHWFHRHMRHHHRQHHEIIIIIGIIFFIVVNVSGSSSLPVRQCTEPWTCQVKSIQDAYSLNSSQQSRMQKYKNMKCWCIDESWLSPITHTHMLISNNWIVWIYLTRNIISSGVYYWCSI